MSEPYLVVDGSRDKLRLSWYLPQDDDIGGNLGEFIHTEADLLTASPEDIDEVIAYLTVAKMPNVESDFSGFYWETQKAAKAALSIVKAAIKAGVDRPLPEWAKQALAAGWKAPKGWKP